MVRIGQFFYAVVVWSWRNWSVVEPVWRKGKHVAARLYCLLQRFLGPLCPLTRLGLSAHQCPQFQKLFAFLQLEKRKCAKKKSWKKERLSLCKLQQEIAYFN